MAGRWVPGESGNPRGKPKGARSRASVLVERVLMDNVQAAAEALAQAAREGNVAAARAIVDKVIPTPRERTVSLALPAIADAQGVLAAQSAIVDAVAAGDITPGEGATLSGIVEMRRKAIESADFERRLGEIEAKLATDPR